MSISAADSLATVDLDDDAHFADGPPHEIFARLRAEQPVHWSEQTDGPGFWSITRAADIAAVSRDTETFSSHRGGIWVRDDAIAPLDVLRALLIIKDPPEHTKYRLIIQKAFTPHSVTRLEGAIRARVNSLIDAVCQQGSCDVVSDIAIRLPLETIAELIGVPDEHIDQLLDWSDRIERSYAEKSPDGLAAIGEMAAYLGEIAPQRRADPRDDLVTALVNAEVAGERLTDIELTLFFAILVFAGNDTTRNTISGGTLALLENPDQLAKLRTNPTLIPGAVEEMLRWVCAIQYFARTATRDTELGSKTIREGDRVALWYASGSRDEDVHANPTHFDIERTAAHQAFGGGGRHFCLGAGLARMELTLYLEELTRRMPDIELAGVPTRRVSNWVNSLTSLPVTFTPSSPA